MHLTKHVLLLRYRIFDAHLRVSSRVASFLFLFILTSFFAATLSTCIDHLLFFRVFSKLISFIFLHVSALQCRVETALRHIFFKMTTRGSLAELF